MDISKCKTVIDKPDNSSLVFIPHEFFGHHGNDEILNAYINFTKIQQLVDTYSTIYRTKINFVLTGYNDPYNLRFETVDPVTLCNVETNMIFGMSDGIIEISVKPSKIKSNPLF